MYTNQSFYSNYFVLMANNSVTHPDFDSSCKSVRVQVHISQATQFQYYKITTVITKMQKSKHGIG